MLRKAESSQTLAIVGLGNVGAQFDGTRHNIGFAAVDEVASKLLSRLPRFRAHISWLSRFQELKFEV